MSHLSEPGVSPQHSGQRGSQSNLGEAHSSGLRVRDLAMSFGSKQVLKDVSFDVGLNEVVALVGPSGSGKSTLLSILTGALTPDAGQLYFNDEPVKGRQRPFAYMPQRDVLLPWRRIIDNAALGLDVWGMAKSQSRALIRELLPVFGLGGTERMYPRQLSGGMRQRVSFLRTVVQERPVLLLDEPFGALDAITKDELQRWLISMWQLHSWTILLITHDIREAVRLADRVLVLPGTPGPLRGNIAIPRDIPRGEKFLTDPRVLPLEVRLQQVLREVSTTSISSIQ